MLTRGRRREDDLQQGPAGPGGGAIAVARGGATSLAFRVLQGLADFLVLFVTARGFGADGRGLYALTSVTAGFAIIPLAGITVPITADLAHARVTLGRLHAAAVWIALGGGALTAGVLACAAVLERSRWTFLPYAAALTPFLLLAVIQQDLYRALGEIRRMSYLYLGLSLATLAAFAAVAASAPGRIHLALAAWVAAVALVALVTLRLQQRRLGFSPHRLGCLVRDVLRRGLPVSLANGLAQLNYRVDVFVVAVMLPLTQVGRYSVAIAMGEALWQVSRAAVTGAYAPIIGVSNRDSAALTLRTYRHVLLLLLAGALVGGVAARLFATSIFGAGFKGVWLPLALLLPGIVARGAAEVLQPFLLVRLERTSDWLKASTIGMILNLVLAVALVPSLGLAGAALSTTVSYLVGSVYLGHRFRAMAPSVGIGGFMPGFDEVRDYRRIGELVFRSARPADPNERGRDADTFE